ncbi:MAG: tetratricopeptide repeat protein [Chitinophagaceae bacterium]|nr:tetratricopeptide repeat protein [Chitinophagaceae bacterium]
MLEKKNQVKVSEPEHKTTAKEVDVVQKARGFWAQNGSIITYVGSAIILLIGGWLVYKNLYKLPKEEKANDAVYVVQKYFSDFSNAPTDSMRIVLANRCLNGDGGNIGALKFITKYSGTDAANLCQYYAGACYLNTKQFDKAIKYLKDFSTGATQIQSRAYGMMGDAYAELKKNNDALDYYKKAADLNEKDEYTSSEFLFKAGLFAESIGKNKDAIDLYKKIKTNYPTTEKGTNIDRYLARVGEVND